MTGADPEVLVAGDREALARIAADRIADAAEAAVGARGRFSLALAGGTTPAGAYRRLALPPILDRMPWDRVVILFGDERAVPPHDPRSNYKMAREAFLDAAPIPAENVLRMRGEDDPALAAAAYEQEMRRVLGADGRIDLVLLGMGGDGHTASIFPDVVDECRGPKWVAAVTPASAPEPRLTLTFPPLNAAREVAFLVAGSEKAAMLRRVLREGGGDPPVPAALVRPQGGRLVFLVDRGAARELET